MKELTLYYPDDDIVIKVKSLNLGDDNILTVDYDTINTNPKGVIDDKAIRLYVEQWLSELVDRAVENAKDINKINSNEA